MLMLVLMLVFMLTLMLTDCCFVHLAMSCLFIDLCVPSLKYMLDSGESSVLIAQIVHVCANSLSAFKINRCQFDLQSRAAKVGWKRESPSTLKRKREDGIYARFIQSRSQEHGVSLNEMLRIFGEECGKGLASSQPLVDAMTPVHVAPLETLSQQPLTQHLKLASIRF